MFACVCVCVCVCVSDCIGVYVSTLTRLSFHQMREVKSVLTCYNIIIIIISSSAALSY